MKHIKFLCIAITDLTKIPNGLDGFTGTLPNYDTNEDLKGMVVYNTNPSIGLGLYVWDGENWNIINGGNCTDVDNVIITGNTVVQPGDDIVLTAASDGTNATYIWYKGSVSEPNKVGTGTVLTIPNAQTTDAGTYICSVHTSCCNNTTVNQSVSVAVIDLNNPPAIPGGLTVSLTGETCFDIVETQPQGCSTSTTDRASGKTDFAPGVSKIYTFTSNNAVSNIQLFYTNTNGTVITGKTTSVAVDNKSATMTASFDKQLNTTAIGTSGSDALTADVTVVFVYNGATYWKTITVSVKDCACCGVGGVPMNMVLDGKSYMTHSYPTGPNGENQCWMLQGSNVSGGAAYTRLGHEARYYNKNATRASMACPSGWTLPTAVDFYGIRNSDYWDLFNSYISMRQPTEMNGTTAMWADNFAFVTYDTAKMYNLSTKNGNSSTISSDQYTIALNSIVCFK